MKAILASAMIAVTFGMVQFAAAGDGESHSPNQPTPAHGGVVYASACGVNQEEIAAYDSNMNFIGYVCMNAGHDGGNGNEGGSAAGGNDNGGNGK